MRLSLVLVIVVISVSSLAVVWAEPQPAAGKAEEVVSLMGMLGKWRYPGASLHGPASMSDGGVIGVQSLKCQAVIATPDPVAAVLKFYEEKLAIAKEPEADAPAGDIAAPTAKQSTFKATRKDARCSCTSLPSTKPTLPPRS